MKTTKGKLFVSKRKKTAKLSHVKKTVKKKFSKENVNNTIVQMSVFLLKEQKVKNLLEEILLNDFNNIALMKRNVDKRPVLSSFTYRLFTLSHLMERKAVVFFSKGIQKFYAEESKKFDKRQKKDFTVIPSGKRSKRDVDFK